MIQLTRESTLPFIKELLPDNPVIVEAGAFDGKDTQRLAAMWPHGMVHAFEPVPEIYEILQNNTVSHYNIRTYPYALLGNAGTGDIGLKDGIVSDTHDNVASTILGDRGELKIQKEGVKIIPFYRALNPKKPDRPSQAGSLLKPTERLKLSPITYPDIIEVQGITLDAWAKRYAIDHVDFLWFDMQGAALDVLMASSKIVATVSIIHVEVEFIQAYENQYVYEDVRQWLECHGFEMIAKDFPDVPTWFFGNAVFRRKYNLQL